MSLPAILIGLALLLASIPIVAGPLLRKERPEPFGEEKNSHGSRRSYEQILLALRDLDFDYQLGVVNETEYQRLRAQLLVEAAAAYEQTSPEEADIEELIETAVRDRRQHIGNGRGLCANCGADFDTADKYCSACGHQARRACPHCEQFVEPGDNFCVICGAQLAIAAGAVV